MRGSKGSPVLYKKKPLSSKEVFFLFHRSYTLFLRWHRCATVNLVWTDVFIDSVSSINSILQSDNKLSFLRANVGILSFAFTFPRTIVDCVTARDCAHEIETFLRLKCFYFVIFLQRFGLRHTRKLDAISFSVFQIRISQVQQSSLFLPHFGPLTCFSTCVNTSVFFNMGNWNLWRSSPWWLIDS